LLEAHRRHLRSLDSALDAAMVRRTGEQDPDPLRWTYYNVAFVLIFFAYECLKNGALADPLAIGDSPSSTFLSQNELGRIEQHLHEKKSPAAAETTPQARTKIA